MSISKMQPGDVYRDQFMMIYSKVPYGNRMLVDKALGFDYTAQISNKRWMSAEMYATMVGFIMANDLCSTNTVGAPAPFDMKQLVKYNEALLKLIDGPEFNGKAKTYNQDARYKILMEQMNIQRIINRNKK